MEAVLVAVLSSEENQTVSCVVLVAVEHPFCGPPLPTRKLQVRRMDASQKGNQPPSWHHTGRPFRL